MCNRIFPASVDGQYFDMWHDIQKRNHTLVEECFSPIPIFDVPFFDREVVGLEMLGKMGDALFGGRDPVTSSSRESADNRAAGAGYIFKFPLPLATKNQIDLLQTGDELVVQVGDYKRNIILPRALALLK